MKRALMVATAGVLIAACDPTSGPTPAVTPSPSIAPNPAATLAGDLRTHLNLLLGEQVMIVAKESVAAINHTDDYAAYTTLLATNASDLETIFRRAFGITTATALAGSWSTQNSYLVDYAIGIATHNDAKAKAAMANLTQKFVPQFAQIISDASHLPLDPISQLLSQQALENKAFIDVYFAGKFAPFYSDLRRAYAQASRLGDAVSVEIAHRFPDKFPGDPELRAVSVRTSANQALQEHSYLLTMATAAIVAGRSAESAAAGTAVGESSKAAGAVIAAAIGISPVELVTQLKTEQNNFAAYAAGEAGAARVLMQQFVESFGSAAQISKSDVLHHVNATIQVVDDQRSKSWSIIANDDRAAATSSAPLGDAIRG